MTNKNKKAMKKIEKNTQGNYVLTFSSNINIEDTYTSKSVGEHTSTMELVLHEGWTKEEGSADVEWYIESLNESVGIGLWWQDGELTDYDGVFCLPKEVRELLNAISIIIPDDFFE